ncbi:unnamed protein product [Spodoptera littoralis]|uniref:Uncharacterized protein n=1 Tax=Spodoptera littoralis TaxID=7109 RepID=A0A9P0I5P5_SPOLI|nr:unnamed protein product [Spodoptera littoralis]CAH1639363.1 unnamed protein product [Spodoptera littoralis]
MVSDQRRPWSPTTLDKSQVHCRPYRIGI